MERAKRKEIEFQLRRNEILHQAERIFAAKGFYNTTILDVREGKDTSERQGRLGHGYFPERSESGGHEMKKCFHFLIFLLSAFFFGFFPAGVYAEEYALEDLYRIALQRAEKIKISEENLFISETGKEKALSLLLPKLSTFGSYVRYTGAKRNDSGVILQPDESTSWGLRLDESLSISGRELTALSISAENIVKSRHDLHDARETYLLNVAYAYYDVLRARKALDIAEANLERLTKYRNAAEKRLKVGEVTKTVLLRADGELSGAHSDHVKAKNTLELAGTLLARIVGIKTDFHLKETQLDVGDIPSVSSFQKNALLGRSDLKSLEIQKKIAGEQVHYAKGAYWPTLALAGVYTAADQSPTPQTLNRESIYGGISINFPLFEGGLRTAEVKEARAKERQSALSYDDLKKTIEVEVQSAYLDIMTQKGVLKFLEDQLSFARDNYRAILKQFEFGLSESIEVMDANTLLVTAQRKLADAFYSYQLSLLKMKRATGTLLKSVTGDS
jgi:outer membrane protein